MKEIRSTVSAEQFSATANASLPEEMDGCGFLFITQKNVNQDSVANTEEAKSEREAVVLEEYTVDVTVFEAEGFGLGYLQYVPKEN